MTRIVGSELVRVRSQTIYYVLTRIKGICKVYLDRQRMAEAAGRLDQVCQAGHSWIVASEHLNWPTPRRCRISRANVDRLNIDLVEPNNSRVNFA